MPDGCEQLTDVVQRRIQSFLTSEQSAGLAVGIVLDEAECYVFGGHVTADRPVAPDKNSLFEIGSITKVFTTLLLAEMQVAGLVQLNDRANQYLPPHGRLRGPAGDEITLIHLATHTSGLPRLPPNLTWKALAGANPYADYTAEDLYLGAANCRLKSRPGTVTRYSNFGSGLLGQILSLIGGADYEQLLTDRILKPLAMPDTAMRLSEEQQQRIAPGHSKGKVVSNWDFLALAGAGALRSSISDMTRFLRANLDPGSTPLREAIELTHQLRTQFGWVWYRDFGCLGPLLLLGSGSLLAWQSFGLPLWLRITLPIALPALLFALFQLGFTGSLDDMALGWHFDRRDEFDTPPEDWLLWHNGGTGGYASYMAFSLKHKTGVVLLANSECRPDGTGRELVNELMKLT